MAIDFRKYIDITSGVGGGSAVRQRDLILRAFSTSTLTPDNAILEFTSAEDVGSHYGTSSGEYLRSVFYFGFISKTITAPQKLSFSRWADVAAAARIYGASKAFVLGNFTSITTGAFKLTLAGYTSDITGLNFSAASTLSNVASILQTAVRAITAGGTPWTSATVTYNATKTRFELVAGATGAQTVGTAAPATGTDIRTTLGWDATALFSQGVAAQEPVDALIASVELSNNFGTFAFIDVISQGQAVAVATQNETYNNMFMFLVSVTQATAGAYDTALSTIGGVGTTVSEIPTEYPELIPSVVLASTDYTKINAVQNYMFQTASVSPSVTTTAASDTLDASRTNYYGRTQTAGNNIDFYQRGMLKGSATDATDMGVYANEMWLKDASGAALMTLFLNLPQVPANQTGRALVINTLLADGAPGQLAIKNGTFSVGKALTNQQKLYITNVTGDSEAWKQVYHAGYWLDVQIQSYVTQSSVTEYKAVYTWLYAKGDSVRKVEGTHILI